MRKMKEPMVHLPNGILYSSQKLNSGERSCNTNTCVIKLSEEKQDVNL